MPVYVFPCFRVSQKRKIKRSPIDLKLHGTYFWTRRSPRSIGDGPEESWTAWYVSNVSIIFDCSMLYYLLFWTLLVFVFHFYIIFGTNLLTGGQAQNCCFFPISEFRRKRISNGVQTEWNLREHDFRNEHDPEDLDPTSRNKAGSHEAGGAPTPLGAPSTLAGPTLLHRRTSSSYIFLRTPKPTEASTKT